jgi:hypothetical protein
MQENNLLTPEQRRMRVRITNWKGCGDLSGAHWRRITNGAEASKVLEHYLLLWKMYGTLILLQQEW